MGRNRKPKAAAERDGTFETHPERRANYANEPKPDGPLGAPPAEWVPSPVSDRARGMFAQGLSTNDVAATLGISWEVAKSIRSSQSSSGNAELLKIWHQITSQAPPGVLTSSDRLHVELTCRLILRIRNGSAKSGDYNTVKEFLGKMAMNPADRPKIQVGAGAPPPNADATEKANAFAQLAEEGREQLRTPRPN
jgi:hypothetical protein